MWVAVCGILGQKCHRRKIGNIHKDFEFHLVFMQNFLCHNVPTFPFYILLTRRNNAFWSGSIDTVWYRRLQIKYQQYSQRFFKFYNFSRKFSIPNCSTILILHTTQNIYYSTNSILCNYPPQLIYFRLSLYFSQ